MKILAVDHGERRIGIAISDRTGTLARPVEVIKHVSHLEDASRIARLAKDQEAELILVGQSFNEDGTPNLAGRRAGRFAESLRAQTDLPVQLWDESLTTQDAHRAAIEMNIPRRKRRGHLDDMAAVLLLQSYLEAKREE